MKCHTSEKQFTNFYRELLLRFQSVMGVVTDDIQVQDEDTDMLDIEQPVPQHIKNVSVPDPRGKERKGSDPIPDKNVLEGQGAGGAGNHSMGTENAGRSADINAPAVPATTTGEEGSGNDFVDSLMSNFENQESIQAGDVPTQSNFNEFEQGSGSIGGTGTATGVNVDGDETIIMDEAQDLDPASSTGGPQPAQEQASSQNQQQQQQQQQNSVLDDLNLESFETSNFDFDFS